MSGEQILPHRLPPSGAEILDAVSQLPLRMGHGSPGLIWRGQYPSGGAGTDIGAQFATPVVIPGLGGAWALSAGHWYDLEFSISVEAGAGVTVNNIVVVLEGSVDGGVTWTVGLGVFTWTNTVFLGLESATYSNGTLRTLLNSDVTNVRLRAGASGNAGDREVFAGFLRAEQYTEGDDPEVVRLNPSGTFLEDASSNLPAQIGSGSPGLIYRAATSTPVAIGGSIPQLVGGLAQSWSMLAGYHYDIQYFACVADAAAGATGNLHLILEASSDNGANWFFVFDQTIPNTILGAAEAREYFAGVMSYVPTVDITNVRCSAAGWVAGRVLQNAWLKAAEYVT